jgi:UDP-N-acetylmuramate: L-alanyl-gamma-D-glutamyl-meso-diaminopimelate ligase
MEPKTGVYSPATQARLAALPADVRHVHLIGVGGSAMTALAGMLASRGFRISGSDLEIYEPAASLLARLQVDVRTGFDARNLEPRPDLVVIGNVVTAANPEAAAALERKIPYLSMPEAVRHFLLEGKRVLMVTGTHGKTTSSAILAHVLTEAGRDPAMLIGGMARNLGSNYRLGQGADFVIEGDEYDSAFFDKRPKFLHYNPWGVILTAVEFDHADIYRDLEHVKSAFRCLVEQLDIARRLVVCAEDAGAMAVSENAHAPRLTFGFQRGDFLAVDIRSAGAPARFAITERGQRLEREFELPVGGRMNILNALGAYALLREAGLDADEIRRGLASFSGVARRQELIGEAAGIAVLDDFAHHPTAIRATLDAVAERFPGRRILAAFEPRSNTSRRRVFQEQFALSFDHAARIYLGPVYFKENDPLPATQRLDTQELARAISGRGPAAYACGSDAEILDRMLSEARAGDVAVFMSNGPFGNLKHRFLAALKARTA